ncbi:MAG: sulfatase [Planctomycetaceae bacterium]|nr:sulfatase [Planctomycetaceae bacterium]
MKRARRKIVLLTFTVGLLASASPRQVAAQAVPAPPQVPPARMNVLLIMADDFRFELSSQGSAALTPNIDRLAARGVTFTRAYCQQALCNPSRSSMLTGLRPDTLGLWSNSVHFRDRKPDVVTLPEQFKKHGYSTRDIGKIFHNWHTKVHGDPQSWSEPEFLHYANHGDDKPQIEGKVPPSAATAPKCERVDVPDVAYYDGRVADEAVRELQTVVAGRPFFLAVGFWKPHAPFNAPSRYWELYDRAKLPKANLDPPAGAPKLALHPSSEIKGAGKDRVEEFTPEEVAEIRHGYYANIAYMDTQVGKVLAALDQSGLAASTIVVFVADHGYHIGEHSLWGKTSCYELDARVPLIIAPPGYAAPGAVSNALVELVDLYPTLCDLCGVPPPQQLDGLSLRQVLGSPRAQIRQGAFTQHPRPNYFDRTESGKPEAMGYAVKTERARYVEWREWGTDKLLGRELYIHENDPNETVNVAEQPEHQAVMDEAAKLVAKQFPIKPPTPAAQ